VGFVPARQAAAFSSSDLRAHLLDRITIVADRDLISGRGLCSGLRRESRLRAERPRC